MGLEILRAETHKGFFVCVQRTVVAVLTRVSNKGCPLQGFVLKAKAPSSKLWVAFRLRRQYLRLRRRDNEGCHGDNEVGEFEREKRKIDCCALTWFEMSCWHLNQCLRLGLVLTASRLSNGSASTIGVVTQYYRQTLRTFVVQAGPRVF